MNLRLIFQVSIAIVVYEQAIAGAAKKRRQVIHEINSDQDREEAETGLASAALASGKYFQYAHVPHPNHYEFGHKRGNDHHFTERHEKAQPHDGLFKTKVRWGDKHGGYGEHYWDYNHAGHDGHDGEESQHDEHYAKYDEEESQNSPVHQEAPKTSIPKRLQPYASTYIPLASRDKRQPEGPVNLGAKEILSNGDSQKTYFADFLSSRDKRQPEEQANLSLGKPLRAGDKQKEIEPLISDFQAFREKRQPNSEGQVILDLEELLRAMDVQKSIQPLSSGYQPSRDKREPNSEGSVGSQIAFEDSERLGSEYSPRGKRQPGINTEDVEFIDDRARLLTESGLAQRHGGNYRRLSGTERAKRQPEHPTYSDFIFEPDSKRMVNKKTGQIFQLTPIK